MDRRRDAYLCSIAPHLFADRYGDLRQTCMVWGFDCGNGWYRLLKEAALKLEPLIEQWIDEHPGSCMDWGHPRASQVKEKYGMLRLYMTGSTDEMEAIIDKAERQSSVTCEACGRPGRLRGHGWLYTRCARCWKRMKE